MQIHEVSNKWDFTIGTYREVFYSVENGKTEISVGRYHL